MAFTYPFGSIWRYARVGQPQTNAKNRYRDPRGSGDGRYSVDPGATLSVFVYVYANMAARQAGKAPLRQEFLTWSLDELGLLTRWEPPIGAALIPPPPVYEVASLGRDELYAVVYAAVRSLPEFAGAVDELTYTFPDPTPERP
jgi:hypothetical protein